MRRLLLVLALLLCTAPAFARSGQNPSSGSATGGIGGACSPGEAFVLSSNIGGNGPIPILTTTTTGGTAGLMNCSLVQAPCTGTFTKLACRVTTGAASSVSECGIFTSSGGSRIASTGPTATTAATNISKTGLSFTLTSGVHYLTCWASSATATVQYSGTTPGTAYNNLYVNTTFSGGTGATQVAPFNAACVGSTNPYTCCTGSGTGTCNGMANRTGVPGIAAASVSGPIVTVGP